MQRRPVMRSTPTPCDRRSIEGLLAKPRTRTRTRYADYDMGATEE